MGKREELDPFENDRALVRIDSEEVFPQRNESAEQYYARMKALKSMIGSVVEEGMKAAGIPHDSPFGGEPKREGLARSIAREVMTDNTAKGVSQSLDDEVRAKVKEFERLSRVEDAEKDKKSFVLESAQDIVYGAREHLYGHASVNFARIAKLWEVIFKVPVSLMQVGLAMDALKTARLLNLVEREAAGGAPATFAEVEDGWKDKAGYSEATMRAMYEKPNGRRTTE